MTGPPIAVVAGQPAALPFQCYVRGSSGRLAAVFGAADVLSASIVQRGQATPTFVPTIGWYTADNTQVGYAEGAVEASYTPAQAALLVPTNAYTLLVWRSLEAQPDSPELIARVPLIVEPLAA